MSNNQNTNQSNNTKPKFNEYRAYEELRMIFVIAIETQNFTNLESRISAWEKKYPLAEFTDTEIIRKIKTILNKDFLSRLIGDYLASKILHEKEKQKAAYDSLKDIIDNAKKTKNYKSAQKEIRKWKDTLHTNGLNLYSFDRFYRARVCTLLLLPSKKLENQEEATNELKRIKENGSSLNSQEYLEAISNWQNTYSISDFPDKLKKELNQITIEVFNSISQKRDSENAILEIENLLSANNTTLPADAIASILSKYDYKRFDPNTMSRIEQLTLKALSIQDSLSVSSIPDTNLTITASISPLESEALSSLKDILNTSPHDMDRILNWIYLNRKINYSEFARETIIKQFESVGYKIPTQNSYAIPDISTNFDYTNSNKVDDLRKDVILNYLGIISQGNTLSIKGKDNLLDAYSVSSIDTLTPKDTKPTMYLEAFDTVVEPEALPESEEISNENGNMDNSEEIIYNIFIEDIMDDPLATYPIISPSKDNDKADSTSSFKTSSESPLTSQDEENLEHAYELSSYSVVAIPILEQVLANTKELSKKDKIFVERIKDL